MPIINGGGNLTGTGRAIAAGEKMNLPVDFNLEAGEIGNILNNYYGDKFLIKNDDNIENVHLLPLTETKILIAYAEPSKSVNTNDAKICVQLLTVSGSNIIDKSETLKFSISGRDDGITTACVLSEKKVLLLCHSYTNENIGYYNICMVYINDNTISIGARKSFNEGDFLILKTLSETKCILFDGNRIRILSVDNDNVSFSPSGSLYDSGGDLSSPCLINKNIFVFCFSSRTVDYNLYLKVGIIADDYTITLGPPQLVEKAISDTDIRPSIQGIYNINETNKILVAYQINVNGQEGLYSSTNCVKIGNITGTTIIYGNKYTFKQYKRVESATYENLYQKEKTVMLSENLALYYEYYYSGYLDLDPNIYLTFLNINDLEIVSSNETVIATDASNIGDEFADAHHIRDDMIDRILFVCSMTDTKSLIVYRTIDNKYYCKLISSLGMFFNYANCVGVYYMPTDYSFKDLPHKPDLLPPKSIKSKISVIKKTK